MKESLQKTIKNVKSWEDLKQLEKNVKTKGEFTPEVEQALSDQSSDLARLLIAEKADIDLHDLTPAEEKIIEAVSKYIGLMRQQGKFPERTLRQLRNRGLKDAAEISVSKAKPTQGYEILVDADLEDLSYEQIIVDHPEEFSPRAIWYARRTLKLANEHESPPTSLHTPLQTKTTNLLQWLKALAAEDEGFLAGFTNAEAAEAIGQGDLKAYGRDQGNIQSRIDFACYRCGLPPLGLAADAPFQKAWSETNRDWAFPVAAMQQMAQSRCWQSEDFDAVLRETERLPGRAHTLWIDEMATNEKKVKEWAFGLKHAESVEGVQPERKLRNPIWSRDELILALDLYLKHRKAPPGKNSPEVIELSNFLAEMGKTLGVGNAETYRNPSGVYMKMMNFMRFDPEYTRDGKVGLTRGNKDEGVVWGEFASDLKRLTEVVGAIRASIQQHHDDNELGGADEPDIAEAPEGRVLTRMHRVRERSRKLVELAKKRALAKYKKLCCEACGFDFSVKYGFKGEGVIDVHHTKPVHTLASDGDKTNVDDLALLCANCHRIVHSSRKWLSIDEVKRLIDEAKRGKS